MGTIAISYKMEARENQLPIGRFVTGRSRNRLKTIHVLNRHKIFHNHVVIVIYLTILLISF